MYEYICIYVKIKTLKYNIHNILFLSMIVNHINYLHSGHCLTYYNHSKKPFS